MLTDYKFWYIQRADDVHISECAVRFFEGEVSTKDELQIDGSAKSVTRYRRTLRLDPKSMDHTKNKKLKKDHKNRDVVTYDTSDFGVISTDAELVQFVNSEMRKDKTRNNIPEQA